MAINSIENTVTFSGSDITVVAYRGTRAATKHQLEKENRSLASEEEELRLEDKRKYLEEQATVRQLAEADSRIQKVLLDKMMHDLTPGAGAMDASQQSKEEGAYQNFRDQEGKLEGLNTRRNELVDQRAAIDEKKTDNTKRLTDIEASSFFTLGSIHTLSYSSFREKIAVRTLGRSRAKDYSRGARTVAGSMVFSLFQEHEFLKLAAELSGDGVAHPDAVMLDQIDPFNIMLIFANEYGAKSVMHLFNVDISEESQQMSVDNVITHNTMNFYATDMVPMTSLGNTYNSYSDMLSNVPQRDGEESTSSRGQYKKSVIDIASDLNDEKTLGLLAGSRGLF